MKDLFCYGLCSYQKSSFSGTTQTKFEGILYVAPPSWRLKASEHSLIWA